MNDLREKPYVAQMTILSDSLLTLTAAIIQPFAGAWFVFQSGIG